MDAAEDPTPPIDTSPMELDDDQHVRAFEPYKTMSMTTQDLDYTAGLIDTDGSIGTRIDKTCGSISLSLSVTQAQKGWACLEFLYEKYGGAINRQKAANERHQASYTWHLTGNTCIIDFLQKLRERLTVKRREAEAAIAFPCDNVKVVPIVMTNSVTGEVVVVDNTKIAAERLGVARLTLPRGEDVNIGKSWKLRRLLSDDDIKAIKEKRINIRDKLKEYHNKEHDEIPASYILTNAYIAGVFDGDGCLDTHCRSDQHHSVTQKHLPLLQLLQRHYGGGTISQSKSDGVWEWTIYTSGGAARLLDDILPYLVGKKKQAELIKSMKPGEAALVHAQLREMKGNINRETTRISKANDGKPIKEYKRPLRDLPRGVHRQTNGTFTAHLKVDDFQYSLGTFKTIEEAAAQYNKFKMVSERERVTGVKDVDWSAMFKKENTKNAARLPEPVKHNEKWIYNTASRTYQVRIHSRCIGTYETLEEAIDIRNMHVEQVENDIWEAKLADPERNVYPRELKQGGTAYKVKIGGNSYGTFKTRAEAITKRNKVYASERV